MSEQKFSMPIEQFMTANPSCIDKDQPLSAAYARMRSLRVRHLPVVDGSKLVGILSQRDLYFVQALEDRDPTKIPVAAAMSADVYVVPPERPLGEVAAKMVNAKLGCAVVVREGRVVGIFTRSDALNILVTFVQAWL